MRDLDRQIGKLRAQQASAWVTELSKPGSDQPLAFVAWLKESPANVREFLMAWSIDQSLDQLDSQRRIDIDALLAQVNERVAVLPVADAPGHRETAHGAARRRWTYRIAAGIAALGLIGWLIVVQQQSGWQEFRTGTGEQRALQLEDGSVVHLNAHSHIELRFSADARDIRLIDGEALFEVHHESRPFHVFTRDTVIRDIGTRFNVYSRADSMKVAVIEGSVELTSAHANAAGKAAAAPVIVVADQRARIDNAGAVTIDTVPDISETTAWWQRRLVYRNEPLAHIVEEFNRYNRRRIRLEGQSVMERSYTGVFNADDPDSLAQVLANDPELIVERQADDTIVVRAR